jgi:hypothetical protein
MGELIGEKNSEKMPESMCERMPKDVDDKWLNWLETWFVMLGNIAEL